MPVTVERLTDLPVILVTYRDTITVEDMQGVFARSLELTLPDDPITYRVVQVEDVESNFVNILELARTSASSAPGSTMDQRYELVLVGHDRWTKLYIQMMTQKQFGNRTIPCFLELEQALEYVRNQVAEQRI